MLDKVYVQLEKKYTHESKQVSACLRVNTYICLGAGVAKVEDPEMILPSVRETNIVAIEDPIEEIIKRSKRYFGLLAPTTYTPEPELQVTSSPRFVPKHISHRKLFSNKPHK